MDKLIERIESGECSNELDMAVEIALFQPDGVWLAVRPNAAGTKLIYTGVEDEYTCRPGDWTMEPRRFDTLRRLALRAHEVRTKETSSADD